MKPDEGNTILQQELGKPTKEQDKAAIYVQGSEKHFQGEKDTHRKSAKLQCQGYHF